MRLNEEIIDLVREKELKQEAQQKDMIREKINLAIIMIGDAIASQVASHNFPLKGTRH